MAVSKRFILFLLQALACLYVYAQNSSQLPAHVQTSLEQAANVTVTEYVEDKQAERDKKNMDELLGAMMMAGLLPEETEEPADLGDPEAGDNDQNANRRTQRDRRRRTDQRRRSNRNQRQRQDDNNRTRSRYNRNQRRTEDAPPGGPLA